MKLSKIRSFFEYNYHIQEGRIAEKGKGNWGLELLKFLFIVAVATVVMLIFF